MSESVNLPALGESVTEGTVTRWLKNVGDRVEVDEPLLEVSTDKVDTEIPSPVAGVIEEILVAEDETVEVGTALVRIGDGSAAEAPADEPEAAAEPEQAPAAPAEAEAEEAEVASSAAPAPGEDSAASAPEPAPAVDPAAAAQQEAASQQPAASQPEATQPSSEQPAPSAPTPSPATGSSETSAPATPAPNSGAPVGYVTPLVRKLANEKGVDISTLTGSGVGGRIRKEDVLAAAEAAETAASSTTSAPASTGPAPIEVSPLRGTTVPMSRLRKVVAERAVQSMQAMAQLTSVVEVDVTKVAAFRDANKGAFLEKTGNRLSFLPFFTLAAAEALKAHPKLNATVDGDSIVYPDHEHVAMAVDTERGLLTPVIKNASDLDLAGIAGQIADLAQRTRDNKLKPDELAGGTFTVTNTGSRGALFDTPVVFLPQVAILGTGIVVKRPVVIKADGSESIAIRSMVYLALSYDHRIVDGADAARFLVAVKERLEGGDFSSKLGI
ncbi:2-oxoglutarate dehydrogenase, E2 component, dihydrolipoamide succinyltransferase [Frigoribacterium sp. MCBA15_019]|uniref:2-oxoglutarate dehydrogenase, E2 component, dihydrolipoamide succinyltransferase n=1 Tax=Frigoribacterium sp. MCBA15_019 TaxID=1898745 RepID=UPI0008DCE4C0|nr:2-oxoglutarate dehydrogenase, E2 component, dihydrolipoamide succinyltransferase [Frigoribacterium sp. MCBA15_019]OII27246.1 2-oxoglutarate dehydrogenase, E2 component, dihydrolipoamide succinyltransferase [Frigoribacterium sp. MCBA15_019]